MGVADFGVEAPQGLSGNRGVRRCRFHSVTAGRDGNINSLLRIAKEFDAIRQSYKGVAKDLEAEQQTIVRGGQNLAYDQM